MVSGDLTPEQYEMLYGERPSHDVAEPTSAATIDDPLADRACGMERRRVSVRAPQVPEQDPPWLTVKRPDAPLPPVGHPPSPTWKLRALAATAVSLAFLGGSLAVDRPAEPSAPSVEPQAITIFPAVSKVQTVPTTDKQGESAVAGAAAARECQGYDPCLEPGPDVDCYGIGANGPRFTNRVRVTGDDPYNLDPDNDGWGCEHR